MRTFADGAPKATKPAGGWRRLLRIAPRPHDSFDLPTLPQQWPRWVLLLGPLILALMAAQLWLSGHVDPATALVFAATDALPWFAALPLVLWLANRFPLDEAARWRNASLHVAAGLALSLVLPLVAFGLMRSLDLGPAGGPFPGPRGEHPLPGDFEQGRPLQERDGNPPPGFPKMRGPDADLPRLPGEPPRAMWWRIAVMRAPVHWLLYALVLTSMQGWRASRLAHARERREAELERQLIEARLTGLSRQLHPHFHFNTLNAIVEYVRTDPELAEEMLLDLSELLRHALRATKRNVVPLAEELELLDRYLSIQRVRFGERLCVERRIATPALEARVPAMLLQPLVENALVHGLDHSDGPMTLTIEASLDGELLRLAVRDDAPAAPTETTGEGIGLANTRQRLETLYGGAFRFAAGARPEGGFSVDFVFPSQPQNLSPENQ